jgi:tetratricopeptide (TPR) repeat protein
MSIDYKKKKCLIVDDFHEFRSSLRFMLQSFGAVSIDGANSAESALNLIQNKSFDLILCDYNLGYNQKDGQQILEEIKQRELIKLSTVFIMITAENTTEMIMGVVEYYPDDYLIKPFTKEILRTRIERAIRKKSDFELVESAVQNKEYHHAIELCEQQIMKNPPNVYEYMKLEGELCLQSGDYDRAKELYQSVLAVREIPWAQIGLGRVLFYKEEYAEAREIFGALIQENHMNIVAYDWLAKTHLKLDASAEAQNILQEAVDISPKSVTRQKTLGEVSFQNNDLQSSEKAFKTAIEYGKYSYFKSPSIYTGLAKVLINKKEPEKAVSVLNDIQREFQGDSDAAFQAAAMKGAVYQSMGKKEESKRFLQEATRFFIDSDKSISADIVMDVAKSCFEIGEKESGLKLIQEVIRNNHEDDSVLEKVQSVFNGANLSEEGTRFIASTRKEVVQINNQGVKLVEEGKLDEAIDCFEKAAQQLPGNKTILANTARALLMQIQKSGKDMTMQRRAKGYISNLQKIDPEYKKIPNLLELYEKLSLS